MSKNSFDFEDSDEESRRNMGLSGLGKSKPGLHDESRPDLGRDLWNFPGQEKSQIQYIEQTRPKTNSGGDKSKTQVLGQSQNISTSQSKGNLKAISKAPVKRNIMAEDNNDTGFDPSLRKPQTNEIKNNVSSIKQSKQTKTIVKSESESSDEDVQGVVVTNNLKNQQKAKPIESSSEEESSEEKEKKPIAPVKQTTLTLKKTPSKVAIKRHVVISDESSEEEPVAKKQVKTEIVIASALPESSDESEDTKPVAIKKQLEKKESSSDYESSEEKPHKNDKNAVISMDSSSEEEDKKDDSISEEESSENEQEIIRSDKESQLKKELEEKERQIELAKVEMLMMQQEKEAELGRLARDAEVRENMLQDKEKELERQKTINEEKMNEIKNKRNEFKYSSDEERNEDNNEHIPNNTELMRQHMIEDPNQHNETLKNEDVDPNAGPDYNPNDATLMGAMIATMADLDLEDLTAFVTRPPPKGKIIQCTIARDKSSVGKKLLPVYHLKLSAEFAYLMSAKKRGFNKTSNYVLGTDPKNMDKKSAACVGKVRSNFLGTEFNAYSKGKNPEKSKDANLWRSHLACVKYEKNFFGLKGPRKMQIYVPGVNADGEVVNVVPHKKKDNIYNRWKKGKRDGLGQLINKPPKWSEEYQAFVQNFYGRVKIASVKNFQLIDESKPEHIFLQFGKVSEHFFTMDFQYPLTPAQAFMICLSSFDFKIACD